MERATGEVGGRRGAAVLAAAVLQLAGSAGPAAVQGEALGQVLDSLPAGERIRVEVAGPNALLDGRFRAHEPAALELEASQGRRGVPLGDVERLWTWDDRAVGETLLSVGFLGGIGFALGSWMFRDPAGGALIGLPAGVAGGLMGGAAGGRRGDWRLRFETRPR